LYTALRRGRYARYARYVLLPPGPLPRPAAAWLAYSATLPLILLLAWLVTRVIDIPARRTANRLARTAIAGPAPGWGPPRLPPLPRWLRRCLLGGDKEELAMHEEETTSLIPVTEEA
jgi:peptidoglycan/LPS O-acetylase OafA/YrhL